MPGLRQPDFMGPGRLAVAAVIGPPSALQEAPCRHRLLSVENDGLRGLHRLVRWILQSAAAEERVQGWKHERRCLPTSSLCACHEVPACQGSPEWDGPRPTYTRAVMTHVRFSTTLDTPSATRLLVQQASSTMCASRSGDGQRRHKALRSPLQPFLCGS